MIYGGHDIVVIAQYIMINGQGATLPRPRPDFISPAFICTQMAIKFNGT